MEGGEAGRTVRIRASIDAADADVDLYVGTDVDDNRRATSDELVCVSAAVGGSETCTIELDVPADGRRSWWALAHSREARRVDVRLRVLEVDVVDGSPLAWTGPGRLEARASSAFRLSWTNLAMAPGESAEGWLRLEGETGVVLGWVPLRLVAPSAEIALRVLRQGDAVRFDLRAGAVADALVLDVPIGTASFEVSAAADGETELALFRAEPPRASDDRVAFRLPSPTAVPAAVATSQAGLATLRIDADAAGRWVVRVRARGADLPEVAVEARMTPADGAETLLAPGLYAPASRPGEGLMVDRTGADWSAVWYVFDDAGASTWLYLQGPRPAAGEAWTPTVYRSAVGAGGSGSRSSVAPAWRSSTTPGRCFLSRWMGVPDPSVCSTSVEGAPCTPAHVAICRGSGTTPRARGGLRYLDHAGLRVPRAVHPRPARSAALPRGRRGGLQRSR